MIHFSKWALMHCRLYGPPHTQRVCNQNCLLWSMSVNDAIWYDHKWCDMSFIWDICMTSVWCNQCMQLEWYGIHVWCNMIHTRMGVNDWKWLTYATGVVSSRSDTGVVLACMMLNDIIWALYEVYAASGRNDPFFGKKRPPSPFPVHPDRIWGSQ